MELNYIEDNVDIYLYPKIDEVCVATTKSALTIGDLHANAIKLLYVLVRHQFFSMPEADYDFFVNLYIQETDHITSAVLDELYAVLERISVPHQAQGSTLRFIGDILADRGSNDYFVLKLLEKMGQNRIKIEVMLSNHDAEFIYNYENKLPFNRSAFIPGQSVSGENLELLIENGLVERDYIYDIINLHYKPNLKALAYANYPGGLMIFSHAAIRLNHIAYIAKKLGIDVDVLSTREQIMQVIDAITKAFKQYVDGNKLSELISEDPFVNSTHSNIRPEKFPFFYLIWNRARVDGLSDKQIAWVHGHDMTDKTQAKLGLYNLDNYLGKGATLNTGTYNVLFLR